MSKAPLKGKGAKASLSLPENHKLCENILSRLKHHKECWAALADIDNLYLLGKVDAMDLAICIVSAEFDKAESEVNQ